MRDFDRGRLRRSRCQGGIADRGRATQRPSPLMGEALAGRIVLAPAAVAASAPRSPSRPRPKADVAVHYRKLAGGRGPDRRPGPRTRAVTAEAFGADLGDGAPAEGLVARVIERFGRLDGLVNNAGLDPGRAVP